MPSARSVRTPIEDEEESEGEQLTSPASAEVSHAAGNDTTGSIDVEMADVSM